MAKTKKKKSKDADFQKVKLKVGRRIPKGDNVTNTNFKSKKIILREVRDLEENPLLSLTRNPSANSKYKLLCLNKLKGHIADAPGQVTGETINTLAKMILDDDERIRSMAAKNIRNYLEKMLAENRDITPFITILLTYLKCAITHLSPGISSDAKDLLEFVIPKCDAKLFKILITTILARLTVTSQPTAKDLELAATIIETVSEKTSKKLCSWTPKETLWKSDSNSFDLSGILSREPKLSYNISFQISEEHDVQDKFSKILMCLGKKEFDYLQRRKSDNLMIDPFEARKLMAHIRISKIVSSIPKALKEKLSLISIAYDMNQKQSKKDQTHLNMVRKKFENLIKDF